MSDSLSFSLLYRRVLIDTWWNVNRIEFVQNLVCNSSFNRYMVECESQSGSVTDSMLKTF